MRCMWPKSPKASARLLAICNFGPPRSTDSALRAKVPSKIRFLTSWPNPALLVLAYSAPLLGARSPSTPSPSSGAR